MKKLHEIVKERFEKQKELQNNFRIENIMNPIQATLNIPLNDLITGIKKFVDKQEENGAFELIEEITINGEKCTFNCDLEIDRNYSQDEGDYWTSPTSEITSENINIYNLHFWTEDGTEIEHKFNINELNKLINN